MTTEQKNKQMENKYQLTLEKYNTLLANVEEKNADVIVRGLRSAQDFSYELPLAQANYKMNTNADTIFLATLPEYSYISSSGVKEIYRFGGDIKRMVPDFVFDKLQTKKSK